MASSKAYSSGSAAMEAGNQHQSNGPPVYEPPYQVQWFKGVCRSSSTIVHDREGSNRPQERAISSVTSETSTQPRSVSDQRPLNATVSESYPFFLSYRASC